MSKRSVTITAAWIVVVGSIVAALITGGFGLFKSSGTSTKVETGDNNTGPVMVMGSSRDVTINYNVPDTETKEAIQALETKLEGTTDDITLNREEIHLLAQALKDLDQRTSGIEKLPDGRTRVGNDLITGFPYITVEEHNAAAAFVKKGDYATAFQHSKRAIESHEESQKSATLKSGDLLPEPLAKIYHVGAISAFNLQKYDLALEWIRNSIAAQSNTERSLLLAATLHQLKRSAEALEVINAALTEHPEDSKLLSLKKLLNSLETPNKRIQATPDGAPDS